MLRIHEIEDAAIMLTVTVSPFFVIPACVVLPAHMELRTVRTLCKRRGLAAYYEYYALRRRGCCQSRQYPHGRQFSVSSTRWPIA